MVLAQLLAVVGCAMFSASESTESVLDLGLLERRLEAPVFERLVPCSRAGAWSTRFIDDIFLLAPAFVPANPSSPPALLLQSAVVIELETRAKRCVAVE